MTLICMHEWTQPLNMFILKLQLSRMVGSSYMLLAENNDFVKLIMSVWQSRRWTKFYDEKTTYASIKAGPKNIHASLPKKLQVVDVISTMIKNTYLKLRIPLNIFKVHVSNGNLWGISLIVKVILFQLHFQWTQLYLSLNVPN